MHQDMSRVLDTLLSILATPALARAKDRDVKDIYAGLTRAIIYLATEATSASASREHALREYASLCPDIEDLLRKHVQPLDHAQALERLGTPPDAGNYDAAKAAAMKVFRQLQRLEDDESVSLRKKLSFVESDHAERVWRARDENTAMTQASTAAAAALHRRDYDLATLEAYIANAFPDEAGIHLVEANFVSGGHSKYTLSIQLSGTNAAPERLILRGDSATSSMLGGAAVEKEFALLSILHGHGVRVPKPLAYEGTGSVFGSPFMLVEWKPGVTIGHLFEMPSRNVAACSDIATELARIHAVPLDAVGVVRGASCTTVEQVKGILDESVSNFRALDWPSPIYELAFDWLYGNIEILERTRGLVHGDYGLNNILIHEERVSTILDWEFSYIGNPAYDLGYFYYQAEALDSWESFVETYQSAGGKFLSREELDYCILLSVIRVGVMICQAHIAFRNGQFSGLGGAVATINHIHEATINRMSALLRRLV